MRHFWHYSHWAQTKRCFLSQTDVQNGFPVLQNKKKKQQWKRTGSTSVSGYSAMNTFVKTLSLSVSFALSRRSFTPWSHRLEAARVMWFYGWRSLYLQLRLSGLLFMSCKFSKCKKKPQWLSTSYLTLVVWNVLVFYLPPSKTRHLAVVSVGGWEAYKFLYFFPSPIDDDRYSTLLPRAEPLLCNS